MSAPSLDERSPLAAGRPEQSGGLSDRPRRSLLQGIAVVGVEILVNFALPFLIYSYGEQPWGQAPALMAASSPPLAWTALQFLRRRRIDALSILVLAGIGLSLIVFLAGGPVRFIQLREKLVTALVGLVFLGSAAIGRPLMYHLGRAVVQRRNPSGLGEYEAMKHDLHFRRTLTIMTLVWGAALVADAVLAAILVLCLTVRQYLLVAPVLTYGVFGALGLWAFLFARARRREGMARRAATQ
jgi:hypothetical protein